MGARGLQRAHFASPSSTFSGWQCSRPRLALRPRPGRALLCLLPTELEVSTAFRPADSPPLELGAQEGYLAVLQEEEVWEAEKVPANADLLTMVVLALCSLFGLSFGLLLTNYQGQEALCSLGIVGRSLASACKELAFLGVLRL